MLEENLDTIIHTFLEFRGSGMYLALFFIAILFVFLTEKNKKLRCLFGYFPLIGLILTLNPFFSKLVSPIFNFQTYWRLYWILPVNLTIAYAVVKFVLMQEKKNNKILVAIALVMIIVFSGKLVYNKENFVKVGNLYRLPDESVLLAQLIGKDDEEHKKAIVPPTAVGHIRQIDSSIELAYRREPAGYMENDLVRALNIGDVALISKYAKKHDCNYVVYSKSTKLDGEMEDYGFEKYDETQSYAIYKLVDKDKEPEEKIKDKNS